ncbi:MAG: sugar phosphate nucleotidyltransferase [Nanoarchaeota archaeon]
MKAVIPAAGLGKRFRPWTFGNAKENIPIIDPNTGEFTSTISLVTKEAIAAQLRDILLIISPEKFAIPRHLVELGQSNHADYRILTACQPTPRGLGDAISYACSFIGPEPAFAVLLGDDFYDKNPLPLLIKSYETVKSAKFGGILTVMPVSAEETKRYGIVGVSNGPEPFRITQFAEKPQSNPPSNLAITGRYILSRNIFDYVRRVAPDSRNEIGLTPALELMLADGFEFHAVNIQGTRYDAGDPKGWYDAIKNIGGKFYA